MFHARFLVPVPVYCSVMPNIHQTVRTNQKVMRHHQNIPDIKLFDLPFFSQIGTFLARLGTKQAPEHDLGPKSGHLKTLCTTEVIVSSDLREKNCQGVRRLLYECVPVHVKKSAFAGISISFWPEIR